MPLSDDDIMTPSGGPAHTNDTIVDIDDDDSVISFDMMGNSSGSSNSSGSDNENNNRDDETANALSAIQEGGSTVSNSSLSSAHGEDEDSDEHGNCGGGKGGGLMRRRWRGGQGGATYNHHGRGGGGDGSGESAGSGGSGRGLLTATAPSVAKYFRHKEELHRRNSIDRTALSRAVAAAGVGVGSGSSNKKQPQYLRTSSPDQRQLRSAADEGGGSPIMTNSTRTIKTATAVPAPGAAVVSSPSSSSFNNMRADIWSSAIRGEHVLGISTPTKATAGALLRRSEIHQEGGGDDPISSMDESAHSSDDHNTHLSWKTNSGGERQRGKDRRRENYQLHTTNSNNEHKQQDEYLDIEGQAAPPPPPPLLSPTNNVNFDDNYPTPLIGNTTNRRTSPQVEYVDTIDALMRETEIEIRSSVASRENAFATNSSSSNDNKREKEKKQKLSTTRHSSKPGIRSVPPAEATIEHHQRNEQHQQEEEDLLCNSIKQQSSELLNIRTSRRNSRNNRDAIIDNFTNPLLDDALVMDASGGGGITGVIKSATRNKLAEGNSNHLHVNVNVDDEEGELHDDDDTEDDKSSRSSGYLPEVSLIEKGPMQQQQRSKMQSNFGGAAVTSAVELGSGAKNVKGRSGRNGLSASPTNPITRGTVLHSQGEVPIKVDMVPGNDEDEKEEESRTRESATPRTTISEGFTSNFSSQHLTHAPDLHSIMNINDWTALDQYLLLLGKNPRFLSVALKATDDVGATPLHTACWKAPPPLSLHMISLLPRIYQDMQRICLALDCDGNTALHLCSANTCMENQDKADYHAETVLGLAMGADLEFRSAAGFKETDVLEALVLSAPEAATLQNNEGDTPLHLAVSSSLSSVLAVSILLDANADVCLTQDIAGSTPLHAAIANQVHEEVLVRLLISAPRSASIADQKGLLPLHYVAAFCHTPFDFVRKLVAANKDGVMARTEDGDTPLHLAISNAQSDDELTRRIVQALFGQPVGDMKRSPLSIKNKANLDPMECCGAFDAPPVLKQILTNHLKTLILTPSTKEHESMDNKKSAEVAETSSVPHSLSSGGKRSKGSSDSNTSKKRGQKVDSKSKAAEEATEAELRRRCKQDERREKQEERKKRDEEKRMAGAEQARVIAEASEMAAEMQRIAASKLAAEKVAEAEKVRVVAEELETLRMAMEDENRAAREKERVSGERKQLHMQDEEERSRKAKQREREHLRKKGEEQRKEEARLRKENEVGEQRRLEEEEKRQDERRRQKEVKRKEQRRKNEEEQRLEKERRREEEERAEQLRSEEEEERQAKKRRQEEVERKEQRRIKEEEQRIDEERREEEERKLQLRREEEEEEEQRRQKEVDRKEERRRKEEQRLENERRREEEEGEQQFRRDEIAHRRREEDSRRKERAREERQRKEEKRRVKRQEEEIISEQIRNKEQIRKEVEENAMQATEARNAKKEVKRDKRRKRRESHSALKQGPAEKLEILQRLFPTRPSSKNDRLPLHLTSNSDVKALIDAMSISIFVGKRGNQKPKL